MTYYSEHKEHVREVQKKYREEHKDELHKKQKEWRIKNKEAIAKKDRDGYIKNKEHHDEQERNYYEQHKEEVKARVRKYYSENKEKIKNKRSERYRKEHPSKEIIIRTDEEEIAYKRNLSLKKRFGITLDDYNQMRFEQDGCCFICGRHEDEVYQLCVDHDHNTNKVRGLLCNNCNSVLGHARDDINVLYKSIAYLKLFR